jgi:hypothetical protein
VSPFASAALDVILTNERVRGTDADIVDGGVEGEEAASFSLAIAAAEPASQANAAG